VSHPPVSDAAEHDDLAELGDRPAGETLTVARNVSTRYLAIVIEAIVGLLVLPFNIAHLGTAAYGLWMLTASVTTYFSVLDLGYAGALVRFVAQYRAKRDSRALNETLSTTFFLFAAFGALTYLIAIVLAVFLDRIFQLTPEQAYTGRAVLLIVSVNVAAGTAFSVFGGVINGFQRYDLNNTVGAISTVVVAVANVLVLTLGYGLIELVAATTLVRVLTYWIYRANAYRVFPGLRIRASLFRRERLRELTTFSVFMLLIDWANKMNYSVDAIIIGAFLNTTAVAVWTIGQRLAEITQRLTNQLNDVLFPTVVDNHAADRLQRLQAIFVQGTRLSLATVIPLAGGLFLMAAPLVHTWVGPEFAQSVSVVQLLSIVVMIRIGNATASTLLKGAGEHKLLAFTNAITAMCNIVLSVAIVKPLALPGVAIGTLVPVAISSLFIVFPAACRRVQLSIRDALADAVWPAVWPAIVMAVYVEVTRPLVSNSLVAVGAELFSAAFVYVVVFLFFGISGSERRLYLSKLGELTSRWRLQTVSEGA
jgi:O-antigen/teichoic acid export membrane protein